MISGERPNPVSENILAIKEKILAAAQKSNRSLSDITLMAVTKNVDTDLINQAFNSGITLFGENRVQEFLDKRNEYKYDIPKTHFIGHLQTNKVKYIIDKVSMIQSVNSKKLADEIQKQAKNHGIVMDILLEVNISEEETKLGILPSDVYNLAEHIAECKNIHLRGLMTIPKKGESEYYFAKMQRIYIDILHKKIHNDNMNVLSMGMSGDFEQAIAYGSNILRIGTAIFGKRELKNQGGSLNELRGQI